MWLEMQRSVSDEMWECRECRSVVVAAGRSGFYGDAGYGDDEGYLPVFSQRHCAGLLQSVPACNVPQHIQHHYLQDIR